MEQTKLFSINLPQFSVEDINDEMLQMARSVGVIACDLETSGLDWRSERIGLCQMYIPDHSTVLIQPHQKAKPTKFLKLIADKKVTKIFHHAMFDLRFLAYHWQANPASIKCTKIASKLVSPERKDHSLATLVQERFGVTLDKTKNRKSDWLSWELNQDQIAYAKLDVIYLPSLLDSLYRELEQSARKELAEMCFSHLPTRTRLEIGGFGDVFSY